MDVAWLLRVHDRVELVVVHDHSVDLAELLRGQRGTEIDVARLDEPQGALAKGVRQPAVARPASLLRDQAPRTPHAEASGHSRSTWRTLRAS